MMNLLKNLENWYNTSIRFPAQSRALFYEILECQLETGVTLKTAFQVLQSQVRVSAEVTLIARACYLSAEQGRPAMTGLVSCNLFPAEDAMLLIAAEKKAVLIPTLQRLRAQTSSDVNIMSSVIGPNLYFLLIAAGLVYMVLKAEGMFGTIGGSLELDGNPAYQLSVAMNAWFWPVAVVAVGLITLIWYGSRHFYGRHRCFLAFFARDAQLQYGARFCGLSAAFYDIGASNIAVLDAAAKVFNQSGFMRSALADARNITAGSGENYNRTLSQTVLLPDIASALMAMIPEDDRASYARANRTMETLQVSLLKHNYTRARVGLQLILLVSISYMLLTMMIGIYTIYNF